MLASGIALALGACGPGETGNAAASEGRAAALAKAGRTIRVPQDHPSLAAAMAAAVAGDTVRLAPGTYRETLELKSGVRVVGGPSAIDATGLDHGITAAPGVTDATVTAISVQGSTLAGIFLDGASAAFRQVASRGSGFSGLTANGSRVSIADSDLSANATRGLNAGFSSVTVEGSRIFDNGAAGVGMEGSTVRVSNCLLRGNGGAANVRVAYGSMAKLEQNQILGGPNGVVVDDGGDPADPRPAIAILEGNWVSGALGTGLAVRGGSARTERNHFDGNGAHGLRATGQNAAAPLARVDSEGDTFDGNGASGILALVGASVTLKGGSMSGNGGPALFAAGADVLCADIDCASTVFVPGSSRASLDHMRLEGNLGGGVVAYAGSQVTVLTSTLRGNESPDAGGVFLNSQWQYDLGDGVLHDVDLPPSVKVRDSHIEGNSGWCAVAYFTSRLDLGGAEGGRNTCVGNGFGGVGNATSPQVTIPAKGNWWGTADVAAIAAMMVGQVDFVPFLTAAP